MVRMKRRDMETRGKVEKANSTVSKSTCQVMQREGKTTTHQTSRLIHIRLIELEDRMKISTSPKVTRRSMPIDVFITPRVEQTKAPTPNLSSQTTPQQLRPRHSTPHGANLERNWKERWIKHNLQSQSGREAVNERQEMSKYKKMRSLTWLQQEGNKSLSMWSKKGRPHNKSRAVSTGNNGRTGLYVYVYI